MLPALAIGVSAFGASELILHKTKKTNLKDENLTLYEILENSKEIKKEIGNIIPKIEDSELVTAIKEIYDTATKIIETVEKKPEKYKKVNSFFNYYLPTTMKILNRYDEIENQRLKTEEGKKFMESTKKMIIKINESFKKQLSNLYQSDMIDTDAEIKVFDTMLKTEGFDSSKDF